MKAFKILISLFVFSLMLWSPLQLHASARESLTISNLTINPLKFDPKVGAMKISFSANDACKVYCSVYDGNSNSVAIVSNGGTIAKAGNWSLTWKGTGSDGAFIAPGSYIVAIVLATDEDDESETLYQNIEIIDTNSADTGSVPVLSNLSLNMTKAKIGTDTVKISFSNDQACKVYCDVYNSSNVKVATVANGSNLTKANRWFYSWTGKGSNGAYLTNGVYTVRMALTNQFGKSKVLSVKLELVSSESSGSNSTNTDKIVTFKDLNLEKSIRDIIKKPKGNILVSEINGIKQLDLATILTITNLSGIEYFTGLTTLNLALNNNGNNISDLIPLKGLKNLQELNLSFNKISDLSPLSGLSNLRVLHLGGNKIVNLTPLSSLTNLKALHLGNPYLNGGNLIKDISPLRSLVNLTDLSLNANYDIKNLDALSGMSKLQRLNLRGLPVADLDFVKHLPQLQSLDVGGIYSKVTYLDPLIGLNELIELNFDGNRITNLKPLEGLTKLKTLHLAGNRISKIDAIKYLTNLTFLSFGTGCAGGNRITDFSPISNLRNLEGASLAYCELKNIDFLRNLTRLKTLELKGNQLKNLNSLRGLVNMDDLSVDNNQIDDISGLANMTSLTSLRASNNKIENIEALRNTTKLDVLSLKGNKISDYSPIDSYVDKIYYQELK